MLNGSTEDTSTTESIMGFLLLNLFVPNSAIDLDLFWAPSSSSSQRHKKKIKAHILSEILGEGGEANGQGKKTKH